MSVSVIFIVYTVRFGIIATNGLQLQEVGDYEAQNCLPALHLIRSTNVHLTTEPPISCSVFGLGEGGGFHHKC
jgi:hypothetical protein